MEKVYENCVPGCSEEARKSNRSFKLYWRILKLLEKSQISIPSKRSLQHGSSDGSPEVAKSVDRLEFGEDQWDPLQAGVGAGQQRLLAGLSWNITKRDSPQDTGATGSEGKADDQTPNGMAFQPSQWWPADPLLVQLAPYTWAGKNWGKGQFTPDWWVTVFIKQKELQLDLS